MKKSLKDIGIDNVFQFVQILERPFQQRHMELIFENK
jgi:hypothetical protein